MTFEELKERASRIQPRNVIEEHLLRNANIALSWVERGRGFAAAKRTLHILKSLQGEKEKLEAADLIYRLLPTACWMLHGVDIDPVPDGGESVRESGPKFEYPPPGPLVEKLESTEAGCRFLSENWASIHKRFAGRSDWLTDDVFTVIRLMGKRPLEAVEDPEVAVVFMAADAFDRGRNNAFMELKWKIGFARHKDFLSRVRELASTRLDLGDPEQGRATIIAIMERAMKRLSERAEEYRLRAESDEAREAAGREFDSSELAREMKRTEKGFIRNASEAINGLLKLRGYSRAGASEPGGGEGEAGGDPSGARRPAARRGRFAWAVEKWALLMNFAGNDLALYCSRRLHYGVHRNAPPLAPPSKGGKLRNTRGGKS